MKKSSNRGGNPKPKELSTELSKFGPEYQAIDFQNFRGFINKKDNSTNGKFCFVISFFQLFFHCSDVVEYFQTKDTKNTTEILLKDIIKRRYTNGNSKAINIYNFISGWDQWYTNSKHLLNIQEDTKEFAQYLLFSCTENINNLFKIEINFENQSFFEENTPYHDTYFLQLDINGLDKIKQKLQLDVQSILSNFCLHCNTINQLPKYLLLYLKRSNGFTFSTKDVKINSFIEISNINYKFTGASIFKGDLSHGHYVTLLKFVDKFVF